MCKTSRVLLGGGEAPFNLHGGGGDAGVFTIIYFNRAQRRAENVITCLCKTVLQVIFFISYRVCSKLLIIYFPPPPEIKWWLPLLFGIFEMMAFHDLHRSQMQSSHPSRDFTQCWFNVGPASYTVNQHQTNAGFHFSVKFSGISGYLWIIHLF